MKKLAEHRGKALKTISNQWGSLKKKLFPEGLTAVKEGSNTSNKNSRKRAAGGENGDGNGGQLLHTRFMRCLSANYCIDASPLAHKKPKISKADPATPAVKPEPNKVEDEEEDKPAQSSQSLM
jgi:hypothetical protein